MMDIMSLKKKLLLLNLILILPFLGIIGASFFNNKETVATIESLKEKELKVIELSSKLSKQVMGLENYLLKTKDEASINKNDEVFFKKASLTLKEKIASVDDSIKKLQAILKNSPDALPIADVIAKRMQGVSSISSGLIEALEAQKLDDVVDGIDGFATVVQKIQSDVDKLSALSEKKLEKSLAKTSDKLFSYMTIASIITIITLISIVAANFFVVKKILKRLYSVQTGLLSCFFFFGVVAKTHAMGVGGGRAGVFRARG